MLLFYVTYYWPRLIFAAYFTFANTVLVKNVFRQKHVALKAIVLFLISCPVVSIVTEALRVSSFETFIAPAISDFPDSYDQGFFLLYYFLCDAVSFIIPTYIYTKIVRDKWMIGSSIYFIYVVIDRYGMVVGVSQITYLIVVIIVLFAFQFLMRDEMMFVIEHAKAIEWRPMLHYLLGLFFLLEALYGSFFVFPEIEKGVINLAAIWVDVIATITTVFFGSFAKINTSSAREQLLKLDYMKKLQDNQYNIILKLTEISEAKSGETGQHVKRVSEYSAVLAAEIGLSSEDTECIRIASMMHDVGKLLIPKEIIEKPGPLTLDETEHMKEHTSYGNELLGKSSGEIISMARLIAYEHHERWDGKGYPRGLKGNAITVYAQIVAVADVYDALTSRRSYKEAWDREVAREEIINQRGKQFSPMVVDAFVRCFDKICAIQDEYVDEE
ncbi:HD-GYP domain-containing protein [Butyrivibrio sp. VCD2006]|uniref:HD-GYP domain-containing protein n=1 Tax=Butyrivibrio sp. VCD2006 TaxID=1280664 RepID=UPI0006869807|nr:HD domain-containing phosphohydrolase [Butyrivibrio sp. VCD2006]